MSFSSGAGESPANRGSVGSVPSPTNKETPSGSLKTAKSFASIRRFGICELKPEEKPDPFEVDEKINPAASAWALQHTVIRLENHIDMTERPQLDVDGRVDSGRSDLLAYSGEPAAQCLLRCIHKVIVSGRNHRIRGALQELVLSYSSLQRPRESRLPSGMETPRSAMHVQDRLRHFHDINRAAHAELYTHPLEWPPSHRPARLADVARVGADVTPARLKPRTVRAMSGAMSAAALRGSMQVRMDAYDVDVVRGDESEDVGGMAGILKAKNLQLQEDALEDLYDDGSGPRASIGMRRRRSSVASGSVLMSPASSIGAQSRRASVVGPRSCRVSAAAPELLTPTKVTGRQRNIQTPKLSGATGGFFGTTLSSSFKQVVEVHSTVCIPVKRELLEEGDGEIPAGGGEGEADASPNASIAPASESGRSAVAGKNAVGALELNPKLHRLPEGSLPPLSPARSSVNASTPTSEVSSARGCVDMRSPSSAGVEHVGSYTRQLLEARGWERGTKKCTLGAANRMPPGAAELGRAARKLPGAGLSKSSSQPCLPKERALPLDTLDTFGIPHQRPPVSHLQWMPEAMFLRGCAKHCAVPRFVKHLALASSTLDLNDQLLGDQDLHAILLGLHAPHTSLEGRIEERPKVKEVLLGGCVGLTDAGVERFLACSITGVGCPLGKPCFENLKVLSLAGCSGVGRRTINRLSELLSDGLANIEELDLSGIEFPALAWAPFTKGIAESNSRLRALRLAATGCGRLNQSSCLLIADLLQGTCCPQLEVLDISGNHFLEAGCRAVGTALKLSGSSMRELDLSHNAGGFVPLTEEAAAVAGVDPASGKHGNPILYVMEALGETTLTKVSFVNCQVSGTEDSVLEDALASSDISYLDVSDNPHGEEGMRSLVRVMTREGSQLETVLVGSCRPHPGNAGTVIYDYVNPAMTYRLILTRPQHRALLRLLLKRAEEASGDTNLTTFENPTLDGKPLADGLKSIVSKRRDRGDDDWQVPEEGLLVFNFNLPVPFTAKDDINQVYRKFSKVRKLRVGLRGLARIREVYRSLRDKRSKVLMIESMRKDLSFQFYQVKRLATKDEECKLLMLQRLLPETTEPSLRPILYDLAVWATKGWTQDVVKVIQQEFRNLVFLNPVHADGHYELDLAINADRGCAQRCLVLGRWVKVCREAAGLPDISEFGNFECLWHTSLSDRTFKLSTDNFQLPGQGVFVFDFVLPRIMFGSSTPASELQLLSLRTALEESPCTFVDKLNALKLIAHLLVLQPNQLRQVVEWFPPWDAKYSKEKLGQRSFRPRAEAYILFYNRTLYHADVVSPLLLYDRNLLHEEEVLDIRSRLGWMHTFDIIGAHDPASNLGNRHGPFDLSTFDGWSIVMLLVAIDQAEESPNFDNGYWSEQAAFYERGFTFILPAAWVSEGPPHVGEFTTTFCSKEHETNIPKRRELATRYLNWTFSPLATPPRSRQTNRSGMSTPSNR